MNRRNFLIQSGLSATALSLLSATRLWGMTNPEYTGPLFVVIHAAGGWDVTSCCDPKMNVPNELEINHWAQNNETQQVGNIRYAPWANNAAFFEKHYQNMMVINGIDAQTNSHDVGVRHNWSGRLSAGYPSMPALLGSIYGPDMPVSWLNNGGYTETADLIRFTRADEPFLLKDLAYPNRYTWGSESILDEDWEEVLAAQRLQLDSMRNETDLLPWQANHRDIHYKARENADSLKAFADLVPNDEDQLASLDGGPLKRQAQIALLAFKAGVAVTADIAHGPEFDTHHNHDAIHEPLLAHLTDSIDYLWEYAEELGLADRLIMHISSDFGRTPNYNEGGGKDHWPIGSAIFMQKNAPWGNRVVGVTDEGHNAIRLNPSTLQPDDNGTLIYPKHIMAASRQLLGIHDHPIAQRFPLNNMEEFDFFNPAIQTPQGNGDPRNTIR